MINQKNLHNIAITGIIRKKDKYLICKRSPEEKAFPNKWCVPGGKIESEDYINSPKDTSSHWLNVFEKVLKREIKEETNLEIENIDYISNLAFVKSNSIPTIIISMICDYKSGEVELAENELVDYAWVDINQAKDYDLIENIYEQLLVAESKQ